MDIVAWVKAQYWSRRDHRAASAGTSDAGLPVILDSTGRLSTTLIPQPAWTNLTYNTGWADYGSGFQGGQYRKIGDLIYFRGLCKRTSGAETTITTLPDLHRPPATLLFDVQSNAALGRVDISTTGVLALTTGSGTWVNLSDIPPFSII